MQEAGARRAVLLPPHPFSAAALVAVVAGAVYVVLSRRTPKALGFAVLTLAAFFLQVVDAFFFGNWYVSDLAFTTPRFLGGDWWRIGSYLFVHADLFHFAGNMFLLATAGPVLEDRIGGKAWTALYLGGGALAIVSHMLLYPAQDVLAVGASGAIFGVLGCLSVVAPNARVPVPLFFIFWFPAWIAALIFVALNVAYALGGVAGVAWYGHFAGMAIGIVAGAFLARRVRDQSLTRAVATGKLPSADALAPLATTPRLQRYLERLRAIRGETPDDRVWAEAWVERILVEATCPVCGGVGFERRGGDVRCKAGGHAVAGGDVR